MANEIAHKTAQQGEIILYQPDETVRLERLRVGGLCPGMVRLEDDTVWLTQAQMAELFQKDQSVIARHIGNVFREGELNESSNMQILHNINRAHDRFLLIDDEVYHIGASLKDLGRKWFAFTLMHDITAAELISRISGSATA